MNWHKLTLMTIAMAVAAVAAPQSQQMPVATQQVSSRQSHFESVTFHAILTW